MVQVKVEQKIGESIQGQNMISSVDLPKVAEQKHEGHFSPEESMDGETPKKKSKWWIWLIVVLILLGAGAAYYFLVFKK